MLVRVEGRHAITHPIAGTRPRGKSEEEDIRLGEELKRNEKEKAEHVMLVDLGRNDIGRVCDYGTVRVPTFMALDASSLGRGGTSVKLGEEGGANLGPRVESDKMTEDTIGDMLVRAPRARNQRGSNPSQSPWR